MGLHGVGNGLGRAGWRLSSPGDSTASPTRRISIYKLKKINLVIPVCISSKHSPENPNSKSMAAKETEIQLLIRARLQRFFRLVIPPLLPSPSLMSSSLPHLRSVFWTPLSTLTLRRVPSSSSVLRATACLCRDPTTMAETSARPEDG
ncbi:unnamed protein product [Linum trigynum]|uniref:Uncharacterized protein n=1 Tax=Linum trigynum TaxID=586398 RepID=A0AAV2F4N4_9ROSI